MQLSEVVVAPLTRAAAATRVAGADGLLAPPAAARRERPAAAGRRRGCPARAGAAPRPGPRRAVRRLAASAADCSVIWSSRRSSSAPSATARNAGRPGRRGRAAGAARCCRATAPPAPAPRCPRPRRRGGGPARRAASPSSDSSSAASSGDHATRGSLPSTRARTRAAGTPRPEVRAAATCGRTSPVAGASASRCGSAASSSYGVARRP